VPVKNNTIFVCIFFLSVVFTARSLSTILLINISSPLLLLEQEKKGQSTYAFLALFLLSRRSIHGEESWSDRHGHELLHQQLHRVRDVDLRDLGRVLARPALETVLGQGRNRHQTAQVAHVHSVRIRGIKQTLLQELCHSV